jgi:GTP-binding protein LepA
MEISKIRNFVIIAHINHGKSTLADRFLEITKTVLPSKMRPQLLDKMALEQERGITIKMQPVRMEWEDYILNLIDTPGHVDFSYEVSRALAAVEGAILLVDAQKGIQAQTLSHLHIAQQQKLTIIPVINKIDLPQARTGEVKEQLVSLLSVKKEEIYEISAKTGQGVEDLLKVIIEKVPAPKTSEDGELRALVFDSEFDSFKGVIGYVRIFGGQIKKSDKILMMASDTKGEVIECGIFKPEFQATGSLAVGEIGYVASGIKESDLVRVGDTLTLLEVGGKATRALAGYQEPKPMVFASFYPPDADDFDLLKIALAKLKLNDAALTFEVESSEALGRGFKCGFLGMLHLEIVAERLKREYNIELIITPPSVLYKIIKLNNQELNIYSALELPDRSQFKEIQEPWVELQIVTPTQYLGSMMKLLDGARAQIQDTNYLSQDNVMVSAEVPLAEIIIDFFDQLKSVSSGFASMNYELLGFRAGDLERIDILVAGEMVPEFSRIVPKEKAYDIGASLTKALKELLPKQQFAVAIQAASAGRIIARETMSALRKDVTGYLYGGDYTRKRKLLEKQKKGKKKLRASGKVEIPSSVFQAMLKKR